MTRPLALTFLLAACSGAQIVDDDDTGPDKTATGDDTGIDGGTDSVGTICGDGVAEGDEVCDGDDLAGNTCGAIPGFAAGDLLCHPDCMGVDTSMCEGDPEGPLVVFNEVSSAEVTVGPYAGAGDAIEFYNLGAEPADLAGWMVSDDADFSEDDTYVFPPGTALQPGEWLVIVQYDDKTEEGEYPFGISSSEPETLRLANAGGFVVDEVSFDGPDAEVSWCRLPDGDGEWSFCAQTFGDANMTGEPAAVCGDGTAAGDEECDGDDLRGEDCTTAGEFAGGDLACDGDCELDTSQCLAPAAVVLNELTSAGADEIELYNGGDVEADLSGWILTDDLADPDDAYDPDADAEKYVFPAGAMIGPDEFLVVDDHVFGLANNGDTVALLDADVEVVDHVEYGNNDAATSYCRIPDGPDGDWEQDCTQTFGDSNQN